MNLFMRTLKHFVKLKYQEICVDEMDEDVFAVTGIVFITWATILTNMVLVTLWGVFNKVFVFKDIVEGLLLGFIVSGLEFLLGMLIWQVSITFLDWINDNWQKAKRLAKNELSKEGR